MNKSKPLVKIDNDLDWKLFDESKLAKGQITINGDLTKAFKDVLVKVTNKNQSHTKDGIIIWPMGGKPSLQELENKKHFDVLIKKIN
ncbi:hypothetical protein OO013_09500 [Mangrovivirga sp. M17]|uniref:Uncharacterized protein n=1 Tax=Mangrovivirga halotolerans TaxID=2993936 RepID=A0ABT3RSG7_9BACT|nr:hypothetical protein [Mangrovivirga halotolerans]MCX2744100.1 hypothetical protein [Mangrovivirga halotolerans]